MANKRSRGISRIVHRDEAIRVARIADHEDAHIRRRIFLDGLSLADENFPVDAEQIVALHAGLARHAADEQAPSSRREILRPDWRLARCL